MAQPSPSQKKCAASVWTDETQSNAFKNQSVSPSLIVDDAMILCDAGILSNEHSTEAHKATRLNSLAGQPEP